MEKGRRLNNFSASWTEHDWHEVVTHCRQLTPKTSGKAIKEVRYILLFYLSLVFFMYQVSQFLFNTVDAWYSGRLI